MKGRAGRGGGEGGGVEVEIDISTSLIASIYPWKLLSVFLVFFGFFFGKQVWWKTFLFFHVYSVPPRNLRAFLAQVHFPEDAGSIFSQYFANFNPLNPLRLISLKSLKVSFNRYYYKSK